MINKDNLKDLLLFLKFEEQTNVFSKHFPQGDFYLKVDFNEEEIIYPEEKGFKVNQRQTCNLKANENFVVFECVHRLLEKGYKPEHIELEPTWKLGHTNKSGRGDILIRNQKNEPLLIIECKTAGKEFEDEWQQMKQDGGQLLSYMDRERTTRFLCLYASDFSNKTLSKKHYIINTTDIGNLVEQFENKENKPLFYKDVTDVKQWYQAWSETYKKDFKTLGIFENDVQAYNIGKENIAETDLQNISEKDIQGKYHQFATTLRQYNVSGRENAFDKLVNLFLCKIVDEKRNPHKLDFYWKGEYSDTYFELQDRLQKLYQAGMKEFLSEDVTYIDNDQIDKAFRYVKNDPDATKDTIKKFFTQLKFFTNNDFAFIDVHNEKLFYQNSVVLLEIVRMLQDIRLCTNDQNQFLGDLFEGFLDAGVKQSEGQFFTPMPITKFILLSLPLQNIINNSLQPPKMIDYACGSGHFLNELAGQIKPFVEAKKQAIAPYLEQIVGIEKEYRLSKVAKVSAFMYGQDQIKIIYKDALAQHEDVKDNTFSVLVANPPYAVKGFLETLSQTDRERYTLLQYVDSKTFSKTNSIQCFFIERAKQLLKPDGVAGIVLPSSILSNTKGLEIATRELILQYFDIVAIVEFGSKTFGKTGTNTVTLFLKRKQEDPAPADQYRNRVNLWFSKTTDKKETIFKDIHLLKAYCQHIEIPIETYQDFLQNGVTDACLAYEIFNEYQKDFEASTVYKDLQKKYNAQLLKKENKDKATIEAEKATEIKKKLNEYAEKIEHDKVYYYVLAAQQPKVLIVKSPADGKAQKQFLGYDWSGAKGKEGIKYLGGGKVVVENEEEKNIGDVSFDEKEDKRILENLSNMKNINTPLYDPNNDQNVEKINYLIQQSFGKNIGADDGHDVGHGRDVAVQRLYGDDAIIIPDNLQSFVSYANLTDLLNFKKSTFDKTIKLFTQAKKELETKWELVKIGEIAEIKKGKSITEKDTVAGNVKVVAGGINFAYLHNEANRPANTITISASGANAGFVNFWREPIFASDCTTVLGKSELETLYFLNILKYLQTDIYAMARGSAQPHVYPDDIKSFKIPLPPLEIQQQIVAECEAVDKAVDEAKEDIKQKKESKENLISDIFGKYSEQKISEISHINPSKTEIRNVDENTLVSFVEMSSVSNNGFIAEKVDRPLKDLKKGSFTYFTENDIIIAKITPCMENGKCALARGLTNGLAMGSSEFHVIRVKENVLSKFVFALLNREVIRKEAEQNFTGSSGHRRVPASFYADYKIPVPPLAEQQKLVTEIEAIEAQIADNQRVMNEAAAQKQAIMKKYL